MKNNLISKIENAISVNNNDQLQYLLDELELININQDYVDILNQLLLNKNHKSHQFISKRIQTLKSPTSIPYIEKVLQSNFDYLQYTCSNDDVIAKWFSHALSEIGTKKAINLIEKYSNSENELIKKEMIYRLSKMV